MLGGGDQLDVELESALLFTKIATPSILEPRLIDSNTKLLYDLLVVLPAYRRGRGEKGYGSSNGMSMHSDEYLQWPGL